MSTDPNAWPFWVRHAMRGIRTRNVAWLFVWLSIATFGGSLAYIIVDGRFAVIAAASGFVLAVIWYYLPRRKRRNGDSLAVSSHHD
jgi:hypothetical protein